MSFVGSIFNVLRFNKKNWKAVALCLMAATVFWFFNALNKTYTTILSFPIEFQYDQDNFITVTDLPTEVKMNVTGMGWTLLRRSAGVKVPSLLLPLERPADVKKIVGSTLPPLFSQQLTDLQINFVATDTLRIDIEPNDGRWIKLSLIGLTESLRQGFGQSSTAIISPDCVFVQGPRRLVKELRQPYPVRLNKKNIDENLETTLDILFESNRLKVEPLTVNVSCNVEQLLEINDSVKVELIKAPSRIRSAVNASMIHYTLHIPQSIISQGYNRKSVRAIINVSELPSRKSRIAPIITGIPPFSQIIRIDTVEVTY